MESPPKALLALEAIRGLYEYTIGTLFLVPLHFISPLGDNHPVMVIPGLGASDSSTSYIRTFLDGQGYVSYPWGLGRNLGPRQGIGPMIDMLTKRLTDISSLNGGQKVSIVGWSLGGIYAREIAKHIPDKVRQVVTLGTPFKGWSTSTHATKLYEILSQDNSHKDPDILKRISIPPLVPFTSIYSKTDGVVSWKCSIEDTGPMMENIEIPGASHLGLGYNPISVYIIANRLAQSTDNWQPYKK